jgi:ubiquinone/menaquinone biosynthesis C-methylase UbiE
MMTNSLIMDKNQIAVSVFNKLASLYQDKFMDVSLYADSLDFFCDSIKKENAEVLELACGPGNITKYLLSRRPDFKIKGTDLAPNMIDLAKVNNPTAEFDVMDCRNIGSIGKKYDATMCGFCLPYMNKEETIKLIADASELLKPGGIFYLSTMEDEYERSGFKKGSTGDEVFMHYYSADFLSAVLKENNFKIMHLSRKEYPEKDGAKTIDLIIIAFK